MTLKDREGNEIKVGDYCWLAHKIRINCYLSKVQVISLDEANDYVMKYKVRFLSTTLPFKTKTLWYIDAKDCLLKIYE